MYFLRSMLTRKKKTSTKESETSDRQHINTIPLMIAFDDKQHCIEMQFVIIIIVVFILHHSYVETWSDFFVDIATHSRHSESISMEMKLSPKKRNTDKKKTHSKIKADYKWKHSMRPKKRNAHNHNVFVILQLLEIICPFFNSILKGRRFFLNWMKRECHWRHLLRISRNYFTNFTRVQYIKQI